MNTLKKIVVKPRALKRVAPFMNMEKKKLS